MIDYQRKDLKKNTFEFLITIPQSLIQSEYQKSFKELKKDLVVEGFRKGKVPDHIAQKHLKKDQIYNHLLQRILPDIYNRILREQNLSPIVNPKIELVKANDKEDWQVKIVIATKPTINLKSYKEGIKKIKAEQAKADIWIPGKDINKDEKKTKDENNQKILNQILDFLLKEVECEISDLIIEDELNQRLTALIDDLHKIGLNLETYLKSKNLTLEQLKKQYADEIANTYKLEFILQEIADKENIQVEQKDLEKIFAEFKDPKKREQASENAYIYAALMRKQKTLDYLINL